MNRNLAASKFLSRRRGLRALIMLFAAFSLAPTSAFAWWSHDWAYRKPITLDPAVVGAEASGVPVLIRLHEGVFRFADAAPEGADLRFIAGDDKTPLKYHIERYDEVFNLAFVWVQVPHLKPGEPAAIPAAIWMYYGNPKAADESDPRGTYDAYQTLVWHLSERGKPASDASGNGNNGTADFASVDSGLIGGAARVDLAAIALPATPGLALAANAEATWSLWVKAGTAEADGVIYSQRDGEAAVRLALAHGVPYVAITGAAGEAAHISATTALDSEHWHHLAITAAHGKATLYVDGAEAGSGDAAIPALGSAAVLGGDSATTLASAFNGQVDELEISKLARAPALIKLAAVNQGIEDKLVAFGADEVASSWSTGYVGIIMGSVTLDGWVIIGILMLMMLVSWVVMARKGAQIGRIGRANQQFLALYRATGNDFAALHHIVDGTAAVAGTDLTEKQRVLMKQSPLLHMFNVGVEELHSRLSGEGRDGMPRGVLSSQSIHAIRATIDSSLIREQQSLSAQMVLLTIAISGGPFIGLLGTVVGVMITFAGVAAAGEVNVNAIAPGISAALAATVAGMAVAIPALFGYNYLITRIKEVSAEMHVFVDAFITRMAENYDKPSSLRAMAD
ncbi:DUF2341 domain-containing protein [Hydrocarboniphaga sp.]|uniref:DUF2341 domain-containing protein n=1 Tax=Hydrocarboniphaga sp. TaxID=2033016 RepID=UPI00261346B6|nr:DUF2341 domain-containing protein [Hydrocarboniphaga sp.]